MKILHWLSRIAAAIPLLTAPAWAATLCVLPSGQFGCYRHIADAVNAAHPADTILVGPGTFYEGVIITKPLSLTSLGATIDATSQPNGIFVDGMAAKGLNSVHISGFTIENAQFEGILVANASSVSISQNVVQNNDKALSGGHCPSRPSFEPGEDQDCGRAFTCWAPITPS